MKTVAAAEANRQFSKILREVRAGESFTITSHGEPVATLAPAQRDHAKRRAALLRYLKTLDPAKAMNLGRFKRDDAYDD